MSGEETKIKEDGKVVKTFKASDVVVTFGGERIKGFAEGSVAIDEPIPDPASPPTWTEKEAAAINARKKWREDVEARVRSGKSKSQELRFAFAELYQVRAGPDFTDSGFDKFYEQKMNLAIDNVLDEAESCVIIRDAAKESTGGEATHAAIDYGMAEGGVVQFWKKNKDGSATLLSEEKLDPGSHNADLSAVAEVPKI